MHPMSPNDEIATRQGLFLFLSTHPIQEQDKEVSISLYAIKPLVLWFVHMCCAIGFASLKSLSV